MNGRNAKMLRRLRQDTKLGKSIFLAFSQNDRALIRADYNERGKLASSQYTEAKKLAKKEIPEANILTIEEIDTKLKAMRIPNIIPKLQVLYQMNLFKNRRL